MKKMIFSVFGAALFLLILFSVGAEQVAAGMLRLDPVLFLAVLVITGFSLLLKGFKQSVLVSPFKEKTSLFENTKIWVVGFFFGTASPAKSGEAVRALYLKQSFGLSLGQGLAVVFVERVLDIAFLFAFGFFGLYFLAVPAGVGSTVLLPLLFFFVLFAFALVLLLRKDFTRFAVRPFFNLFAPEKFRQGMRQGFGEFYSAIGSYKKARLSFWASLLTVVNWLVVFVQFYVLAMALSLEVGFLAFIFAVPVIFLVEALPISLAGVGTRDAASVLMLGLLGIAAAAAVSFSLTVLLLNIITAATGFAIFNSMEKPI